jgi:hypothetical protein
LKDQYFGDVNDFRKYGLLRALAVSEGLRLGVCWMLTEGDKRTDGNLLGYLSKPKEFRHRDPELFDWLRQIVAVEQDRRTARIEGADLLGAAVFQSRILTDRRGDRLEYFSDCSARLAGCDLVFFDPDMGLEVSKPRGRKLSCQYLYWDEVQATFDAGSSVLIYQHFPRQKREEYIPGIAQQLKERTGAPTVFSFHTPHVLFILAVQERHSNSVRIRKPVIESGWKDQIAVAEH